MKSYNGAPTMRHLLLALLVAAPVPLSAAAQEPSTPNLKITLRDDGVRVITNESPAQRARRVAWTRVAVPEETLVPVIQREAERHGLAPELIQAVIQAESGYNPQALSKVGAMGLMQLMPATAAVLAVDDPWDPVQNIRGGVAYLRRMLDRFGRLELALAAYNAGPTAVERYQDIPPYRETRTYVARVLRLYRGEDRPLVPLRRGNKPSWVRGPDGRPLLTTGTP